jgi:hypothetical protein
VEIAGVFEHGADLVFGDRAAGDELPEGAGGDEQGRDPRAWQRCCDTLASRSSAERT